MHQNVGAFSSENHFFVHDHGFSAKVTANGFCDDVGGDAGETAQVAERLDLHLDSGLEHLLQLSLATRVVLPVVQPE